MPIDGCSALLLCPGERDTVGLAERGRDAEFVRFDQVFGHAGCHCCFLMHSGRWYIHLAEGGGADVVLDYSSDGSTRARRSTD